MHMPALLALIIAAAPPSAAPAAGLPEFKRVEEVVAEVLRQEKDYQAGDLITRKQVRTMLDRIEGLGWKVAERSELEELIVDDGSFLAGKARTSTGKKFLRQIADMRLAYDRIDRLGQLPQGRSTVERLIAGPDGYKLFEYMADDKGGKALGKMLSKDGHGNFNQPTGKLYTAEALRKELETRYKAAVATAKR